MGSAAAVGPWNWPNVPPCPLSVSAPELDSLLQTCFLSVGGDPLAAEVLSTVCIDDRWFLHVDLLDQHVPLLSLLWWTKFEHLLETREVTETIVAALLVLSHRLGRASSAMFRSMDAAPSIAPEIAPSTPAREPRTESLMLSREEGHSRRWMSTQVPLMGFGLAPRWQFPHPCTHSCPMVRSTPKSSRVSKGTVGGGKTRVKI